MKREAIAWILLALTIGLALYFWDLHRQEKITHGQQLVALNDSVVKWRNKHGHEVSQKKAIIDFSTKQIRELQGLDGTNKRIQELLQENKKALAAISHDVQTISIVREGDVQIINYKDTLPVYFKSFSNQWEKGSVTMGPDSLKLDIKTFNKFDYIIDKKRHWFKPDTIFIQATNLNPNSETLDVSAYKEIVKKRKWHLGPYAGYGINSDGLSPSIGFSIQYSIISF
jgi:hypothetical protein